jgi:hypothetical protein
MCLALAMYAGSTRAAITITSDEVWDGVTNPHAADGVTLNNGVYTIPTSVTIAAGVSVYLQDPISSNVTNSITWEFLPGAGGLTFGDSLSTIDVYTGARNLPQKAFTLNMNDNNISAATPGAGRIINGIWVVDMMTGDAMSININSQASVTLGAIDITVNDAQSNAINVIAGGLVDIDRLAQSDVSTGGGGVGSMNIRGESLIIGDIDTRSFRSDGNGANGTINLRALGQPENSVGNFNANFASINTILLEGDVTTNAPPAVQAGGALNVTGVKVTLAPTFTADLNEGALFTVNAGAPAAGFTQAQAFMNNSTETPDAVNYTVFHDGAGPDDVEWDNNGSGNWFSDANWTPAAIPNANSQRATFAGFITSPQTIFLNQGATVKGLRFDTPAKVAVSGTAGITLEANTGSATVDVVQGAHEMQVQLTLNDTTNVSAAAGSQLDLNGVLNLNGNTLNVSGAGQVNVNNQATGGGSINSSGTLGTAGLTGVTGNLTSTGALDIDIAGTAPNFFDAFSVTGSATLSGMVNVDMVDGFTASGGQSFTILTASSVSAASLTLGGPDASAFTLVKTPTSLVLQAAAAGDSDFDNDGDVDGRDLLTWQRGAGKPGTNATGDADGNGQVNGADLGTWRGSFGSGLATPAAAAVPEPATAVMSLVGLALVLIRRRQK